ncbi:hypothetical protein MRB53_026121 [Persea americana]|uniref:Uncharacterized protein n=1 Tax=Persea americana TaxID=3435 RepID=A0ACC2LHG1_PERAE|nr:hypothetical protein MRB53_026121 [Persea americana]
MTDMNDAFHSFLPLGVPTINSKALKRSKLQDPSLLAVAAAVESGFALRSMILYDSKWATEECTKALCSMDKDITIIKRIANINSQSGCSCRFRWTDADFMAMKGLKLPQKLKKRSRLIQKGIHVGLLFKMELE